jgi:hypothetical protein
MMMTLTAKIDFDGCPTCGRVFRVIKPVNPRSFPKPGSFIVCRACKALLIFRTVEPDSFRLPTDTERMEITRTTDYMEIIGRLAK